MSAFGENGGHGEANRKSRLFDHLTRLEEQAEQSTLSDNVAKRAKAKNGISISSTIMLAAIN